MDLFKSMDTDGNGVISKEELIAAFYSRGVKMDWAEADELFKQVDTDQDGSLSFDELVAVVAKM